MLEQADVAAAGGAPYGVGLMAWALERDPAQLDALLDPGPDVAPALVSVSFGRIEPYVDRLRAAGLRVAVQAGTVAEAVRAERAGADLVVARGAEGGGHGRDEVGTLPLLQGVLDRVEVPVVAGGGIGTPRGLAAVLAAIMHHDATLWFKREFRSVASLRHPNLVELYELVAHEQSCYFTMEYLPGRRSARVGDASLVPPSRAPAPIDLSDRSTRSAVPIQAARTEVELADARRADARSCAPCRQVDFGRVRTVLAQLRRGARVLARAWRDPPRRQAVERARRATAWSSCSTSGSRSSVAAPRRSSRARLGSSAPRRTSRRSTSSKLTVSPAMDIYALGVVAFELVTGAPPFGGTLHVLSRLDAADVAAARELAQQQGSPEDLDDLIDAMLTPIRCAGRRRCTSPPG